MAVARSLCLPCDTSHQDDIRRDATGDPTLASSAASPAAGDEMEEIEEIGGQPVPCPNRLTF